MHIHCFLRLPQQVSSALAATFIQEPFILHTASAAVACHLESMRRALAPVQCAGIIKAKRRCSITVESKARTDSGRLAREPLRRCGRFCLFHAQIFNSLPAQLPPAAMVFYLESLAFWGLFLMGVALAPSLTGGAGWGVIRISRPLAWTFSRSSSWRSGSSTMPAHQSTPL